MKHILPALAAVALCLVPLGSSYAALDSKIVSADARWLVHIDFNVLRQSEIGREIIATATKNQSSSTNSPVQVDLQKVLATIGRATAYGANFDQQPDRIDGTLVIEGTPELRKIAEGYIAQAMLAEKTQITEVKDLPFEAYSVGGDVVVGFPQEPIILVSKVKAQLVRAHTLYLGQGASMAKASTSPLRDLVPTSNDAFLVAASVVPGESIPADGGPHARIMKLAESAAVSLGEKDRMTFANLKLVANSTDTADKLLKIVQGLTAMASLTNSENNDLEQFMKSVTVERKDNAVLLKMSYSSQSLSGMIKNLQQDHAEQARDGSPQGGKVIAEWKANATLSGDQPSDKNAAVHTIEKVRLDTGAIIRLTGMANAGEHARLDYIEIQPVGASTPALKFEAEYLKLNRYRVEKVPTASGGKVIGAFNGTGLAELQFPGATGDYTLTVHYFDETDGQSTFMVRVDAPAESNE